MVQGEVALVVEMALRAYPTVHWLSGRLNSGFECIKRFSPQATQTQLNCLRNTHFFNASLQKLVKTNWALLYLDSWRKMTSCLEAAWLGSLFCQNEYLLRPVGKMDSDSPTPT